MNNPSNFVQIVLIAKNFKQVQRNIINAAEKAGRDSSDVRLVAVTKEQGVDTIAEGLRAGAEILGENKIQDAQGKVETLGRDGIEWHFIGHLQKNKVKFIFDLF
ncbi:MAG TPA: hypothetical protein DCX78_00790, partial [Nitrospina sp.]|nr:hypothetical protein [Nitrospina sp.]